jgi:hypothetical protein
VATWVGVDPGGRDTGIVLRLGGECFGAFVVTRTGEPGTDLADWEAGDWAHYLGEILGTVALLVARAAKLPRAGANPARVAVEGLTNPGGRAHGQVAPIRPIDLAATGLVLGAVVTAHPTATVVAPGGHGSGPTIAYPAELVGSRERAGRGRMRHARSAWDVAGAAPTVHRLAEAGR